MPFKPWQSWNPSWRPVWMRTAETLFRDAIAKIEKSMEWEDIDIERELIINIFKQAKNGNLKAMEMYLDRLYGKPKISVDQNTELTISELSEEQAKKIASLYANT